MTTRWRKAIRDFWEESTRTMIVVLAIAVGISGFTAVLASYAILTRELNSGYLATNPASATLRTDVVDDNLIAAVKATPGVRDVEPRRTIHGRIKHAGEGAGAPLVLFVIEDFDRIRISKLNRERGAWPPATGEILIERDAFQVARVHIGDRVSVRTLNGPERSLRISGSVHDVGQAQARMENIVYGYATPATLQQLGEALFLDQLKLTVDGDERRVREVVTRVRQTIESRGHPVRRVDIPPPGKHPHADIMGLLLLSLASFGLFVMILSGVIVVNLLTALMAAQIRQIGVMKTIGGTRWQIARIYFGQALLLGAAALAIAIPAGIAGSRALCRAMAVFLNFDIDSFAIPAWVFLLTVASGLLVPLLAAAVPVWKGTGVTIRRALSDFGVSASGFGTTRFDRMLTGIGGTARPLLFSIRNSFRRRTRLLLTVITLGAGGLFFMTASNLRTSMIGTIGNLFETKRYDLFVSIAEAPAADVERIVRNTPGVRSAEAWNAKAADRYTVIALPPRTKFLTPVVTSGRWLQPDDSDAMVINSALAAKKIRLGNVVGIVREPLSPATAYVPLRGPVADSLPVVLDKNDPVSIDRAKILIEANLRREGIKSISISSKNDSRFSIDQHMLMIYVALIIMSAMIGGVGGLGLMTSMSLNVLERRRELGVLRAIGATPRAVSLMLVAEGTVVALASWTIAALAAWPLSKSLGVFLIKGFDFTYELRGLLVWLALSLILGAIASVVPAWRAAQQPIREALGYE
jgi:putative ABC transport system permease protein